MKYRKLTPVELSSITINQYDTGFSLWIKQPGVEGYRCILDASLMFVTSSIILHPPTEHPAGDYKYGSIIGKNSNEIMLVTIL